jgi:hypothetical protein
MKFPSIIMPYLQHTEPEVDHNALKQIMEMGFPEWMAMEALKKFFF